MPTVASPSPLSQLLRTQLLARRDELRAQLQAAAGAAARAGEQPPDVRDFKDVAADDTLAVLDGLTAAHAADELNHVAAALRRLDDGSYGFCQDCGEAIAERRLLALPASAFCTACQSVHERPARR